MARQLCCSDHSIRLEMRVQWNFHRLSEQLLQHVYVYWLTHSVELRSKEIALCSQRDSTRQLSMDKLNLYWYQNRYKMVHFTKEIVMLLGASLAVMWFLLWFCLFNMHFSVQCTSCRWPEGIQSEISSLAIMCCLPCQKVQFRYRTFFYAQTLESCTLLVEFFAKKCLNHFR